VCECEACACLCLFVLVRACLCEGCACLCLFVLVCVRVVLVWVSVSVRVVLVPLVHTLYLFTTICMLWAYWNLLNLEKKISIDVPRVSSCLLTN
jgi:hypothetical protein